TWAYEHRRARDDGAAIELDALQLVVVDDEPGDGALDDADATGGQLLALFGAGGRGVGEQDDVGRPLPHQQRVLDRLRRTQAPRGAGRGPPSHGSTGSGA